MKIYNTLTQLKEDFVPQNKERVTIYVCGPTVYNLIHIGNARPLCVFDVLRRFLKFKGYNLFFVQNFTDIDDKIIKKANEENTDITTIAEKYIKEYQKDAQGLGIMEPDLTPRATECIDEVIKIVEKLIEKGHAYTVGADVYFNTKSYGDYGCLSHMPIEDLEATERVEHSQQKLDNLDFVLWKSAKPSEPSWPSPWGDGRPGWHIECSAMVNKYIGKTVDIHGGGIDLVFPHHENELAQSYCSNDAKLAKYWMHNGHINVDNKKMSKSLGNFFLVREVAEKYGYEPIRLMMISAHYRSPINYSMDVIEGASAAVERLYNCRNNLEFLLNNTQVEKTGNDNELISRFENYSERFIEAMEDDLNTADAVGVLFELVREINKAFADSAKASKPAINAAIEIFERLCSILGLVQSFDKDSSLDEEIQTLIAQRQAARKAKDYKKADEIRDRLRQMGVILEDTAEGVKWRYEK